MKNNIKKPKAFSMVRKGNSWTTKKLKGFSLIELLVVIAIIGTLSTMVIVAVAPIRQKARDTKRKSDLSQIGQLISMSCYVPNSGSGTYDLVDLTEELKIKYPQYASFISKIPKDPKSGTDTKSYYYYILDPAEEKCAFYANLENENEPITLSGISEPTAGGGKGVLEAAAEGWNGSKKYFQVSH